MQGAREEARAVEEVLKKFASKHTAEVKALISDEGTDAYQPREREVINELVKDKWRVIHIAGHGEAPRADSDHKAANRSPSATNAEHGVVLSDGTFLGPNEIKALASVPELVFMNCCHLGAADSAQLFRDPHYDRAEFAAGIARDLIMIGVKCVVAAGWAVEDQAAKVFATEFYAQLTAGQRFRDAVAAARRSAFVKGGNTWAAYQCYGDPDWRLVPVQTGSKSGNGESYSFRHIATPDLLTIELQNIATGAATKGARSSDLRSLNELERRFARTWGTGGAVAEAFANAWADCGRNREAIEWYRKARTAEDGCGSAKATERLANLQVRQAWEDVELLSKGPGRKAQALKACARESSASINQSLELLEDLLKVKPTAERLALCGSAYKRLAMIAHLAGTQSQSKSALQKMADYYQRAEDAGSTTGSTSSKTYYLQNLLSADFVMGAFHDQWKGLDADKLKELQTRFDETSLADPSFWSEVGVIEIQLLTELNNSVVSNADASEFASAVESIESAFEKLFLQVKSRKDWGSVYDQTSFLAQRYEKRVSNDRYAQMVNRLIERLSGYAGTDVDR